MSIIVLDFRLLNFKPRDLETMSAFVIEMKLNL